MDMKQLDNLNCIVCVSDCDSGSVIYLNRYARAHFQLDSIPVGCKNTDLLARDDSAHRDCFETPLKTGDVVTKFLPALCGITQPVLLENVRLELDGKAIRIDTVRPIVVDEENSESLYTMLFESAYLRLESSYHGVYFPEQNIGECLAAALTLYEADSAYIIELDEELEACQSLYTKRRGNLSFAVENSAGRILFSNLFTDIIKQGEPFIFITEELKESHPAEYSWLSARRVTNAMGMPFTTRTGLVAFFGVMNVRRFWNKTSFLGLSTKALFNEIRAISMHQVKKNSCRELSDEDVMIKLFGGFQITTNTGTLDFSDFSYVQCSRFLLYLLKNRDRTITIRELSDVLWPDQLIDNPYNMVKGVAFRVRKILDSICPDKLVIAKSGTYAINDKLTIILDTESFDRVCDGVHGPTLSVVDKQFLYEKALRLYKGDMLPNFESEIWLIGWIGYYQMKYLLLLKEYLTLLQETEQYTKIFEVVSNIKSIDCADDEVYEFLITALLRLNKLDMAKSYYMRLEKFLSADRRKRFVGQWSDYKKTDAL